MSTESQSRLQWTTKRGTTRADADRGGYWITWSEMPGWPSAWCNAWVVVDGKTRNIEAGTKEQCKRACEAHFAKHSSNNSSPQQAALL